VRAPNLGEDVARRFTNWGVIVRQNENTGVLSPDQTPDGAAVLGITLVFHATKSVGAVDMKMFAFAVASSLAAGGTCCPVASLCQHYQVIQFAQVQAVPRVGIFKAGVNGRGLAFLGLASFREGVLPTNSGQAMSANPILTGGTSTSIRYQIPSTPPAMSVCPPVDRHAPTSIGLASEFFK